MRQARGFTLVELIIIIVILGILAATALPRFINLSADARAAVVKAYAGSYRAGVLLAYSKYQLESSAGQQRAVEVSPGVSVTFNQAGYPISANINTPMPVVHAVDTEADVSSHPAALLLQALLQDYSDLRFDSKHSTDQLYRYQYQDFGDCHFTYFPASGAVEIAADAANCDNRT